MPEPKAWDQTWTRWLQRDLCEAAVVLSDLIGRKGRKNTVGLIPAVYFPHIRMGSVIYADWRMGAADVAIAFPWGVDASELPPPYGCYVPRFTCEESCLITHVAAVVDELKDRKAVKHPHTFYSKVLRAWVGTTSWDESTTRFVLDEPYLTRPKIAAVTTVYVIPDVSGDISYVPLFYIQSNRPYKPETLEQALKEKLEPTDPPGELLNAKRRAKRDESDICLNSKPTIEPPLARAVRSVIQAANVRAQAWLNPKTGLLSQQGLTALEGDLKHRILKGHSFAKLFFDIDHFKAMNDEIGYKAADVVARSIADRVLRALQDRLDREFREAAEKAEHVTGRPAEIGGGVSRVPDAFRAFVAHVSGDEFKLYVRLDSGREPVVEQAAPEKTEVRHHDAVAHVVDTILSAIPSRRLLGGGLPAPDTEFSAIQSEALRQRFASPTTRRRLGASNTATQRRNARPVTVSLGVARLEVRMGASRYDDDHIKDDDVLGIGANDPAALDIPLHILDIVVERALEGAKNRGRGRAMSADEVLPRGGIVVERVERQVRLSLGQTDGVEVGTEFDVYRESSPEAVAEAERVAQEERRSYRQLPSWVARVRVHQMWPRESMAHVVTGNVEEIQKQYWLRKPGPALDQHAIVRLRILPVEKGNKAKAASSKKTRSER
jgi:GGDEF domain-containing protein